MKEKEKNQSFFKSSEEIISMFLGLLIVVLVVSLVVNYFQRGRGKIDLPGIADTIKTGLTGQQKDEEIVSKTDSEIVDNTTYQVKKGDSLWKVAADKLGDGNKWTEIAKYNNLSNPRVLLVGQNLKMPTLEVKAETTKTSPGSYVVKRGDNLWKISVQVYGDGYQWMKVYRANKNFIKNPNQIEVGMKLAV